MTAARIGRWMTGENLQMLKSASGLGAFADDVDGIIGGAFVRYVEYGEG